MSETREIKVDAPPKKDILQRLLKSREASVTKVKFNRPTLDNSNKFLHEYAEQLSKAAEGHDARNDSDQAEEARQRAIDVMLLVSGGEQTVDKGKFREALLCDVRDELINELTPDLQENVKDFNDKDRQKRSDARRGFKNNFNALTAEQKDEFGPVIDKLRELNHVIFDVSTQVASAEGRTGKKSKEEVKRLQKRGEIVAPVSRERFKNRFGRWLAQRSGRDVLVWTDPNKMTTVQKEMIDKRANAFDLHRESVAGDMDKLVEEMTAPDREEKAAKLKAAAEKRAQAKAARTETTEPAEAEAAPHELTAEEQAAVDAAKKKLEEEKNGKKEGYNVADKYKTRFADIVNAGGTPEEQAAKMKGVLKEIAGEFSGDVNVQKVVEDVLGKGFEEGQAKLSPEQKKKVSEWRWLVLYLLMTLPESIVTASLEGAAEAMRGAAGGN